MDIPEERLKSMMDVSCIIDKKMGGPVCPLQQVDVKSVIDGYIAEVNLTQNFMNSGNNNIEALYIFPLPHNAQVTGFMARIGENEIEGEFREKEEAFKIYDSAMRNGDTGFLLESHRPDIFQISLGNIAAWESVYVRISYIEEIKPVDGQLRWVLPMVVAPRYIPGTPAGIKLGAGMAGPTDSVPDADNITPPIGKAPYTLRINAVFRGVHGITKVSSPSHPVEVSMDGSEFGVSLSRETELLDSDFILTAVIDDFAKDRLVIASGANGECFGNVGFAIEIDDYGHEQKNFEYICLVDVSGSMAGEKLEQAKRALKISLRNLMEGDRFNIVAFESKYSCFSKESVAYTQENLEKADKWITALEDMGGTEIYQPLCFVLEQAGQYSIQERIILLFTDGQVGNEKEIINLVERHKSTLQLYPFGIDTAVNRYFIDSLAETGNGMPEYVYPGERIEDKVIRQFARIHQPYISNARITGKDGSQIETMPVMPQRLYNSESYSFVIRIEGAYVTDSIFLRGDIGCENFEKTLEGVATGDLRLLSLKWAKEKIRMLERQMGSGNAKRDELVKKEIIALSQKYKVLSTLTSLVAIHRRFVKTTGLPETIVVPVAKPRGWDMLNEPSDVRYCLSAPSRSAVCHARFYGDSEDEGTGGYREADIPAFLRKRSVNISSRKGMAIEGTGLSDYRVAEGGEVTGTASMPDGMEEIYEAMRMASEKQNADGSFGEGSDVNYKTSCYIIGMLMHDEEWKPYRIQVTKAGGVLFTNEMEHKLLKAIALNLIREKRLYKGISFQLAVGEVISKLSSAEKAIYDAFKEGDIKLLSEHIGIKLSKDADKKELILKLLSRL